MEVITPYAQRGVLVHLAPRWERGYEIPHWWLMASDAVQGLALEFPPGTIFAIDGTTHYVSGYTEEDEVVLTRCRWVHATTAVEDCHCALLRAGEVRATMPHDWEQNCGRRVESP